MAPRTVAFADMVALAMAGLVVLMAPTARRVAWAEDDLAFRTWSDSTGRFQIDAALVTVKDGAAVLERKGGDTVSVPLTRLSREDQKFVREELVRRRGQRPAGESLVARQDGSGATSADTEWPQWRGPNRDGIAHSTRLLDPWPEQGPPLLWQTRGLGSGYSSVAVTGGRIFTQGNRDGVELICLDAENRRELWSARLGGHNNPTGAPTVDGDLVFAEDNDGNLICVKVETGEEVWRKSLGRDFGGGRPNWGFSESPLVDGDRLICTPGGQAAMLAALDKRTGDVVWACPAPVAGRGHGGAGYSSPVISHAGGVKQYVQLTGKGVIGVRADDGKLLWTYDGVSNGTANIPTPIVNGDFVFCSSGYNTGSALLKITARGREAAAQEAYFLKSQTFQNHHGGMVLVDGFIYAGHGHNNGFPICIEMRTGKVAWGGDIRGPGSGSAAVVYADGDIIYRFQNGTVALVEATPREFRLKSQFKPWRQQGNSWSHPVIADGKLYLREQDVLMCYDLRR